MKRFSSIRSKFIILFVITSLIALLINVLMYYNINQVLSKIDRVYEGNLELNDMNEELKQVQRSMYLYLKERSTNSLMDYYRYEQEFQDDINNMRQQLTERQTDVLQTNICNISDTYLLVTNEAVTAKRGRNIAKYNDSFEEATNLYQYLTTYITQLNKIQFQSNSDNYKVLQTSLQWLEIISSILIFVIIFCDLFVVILLIRKITKPLEALAKVSNKVSAGEMDVQIPVFHTGDEVEVLSQSFDKMMASIHIYVERQRESMEKELKTQTLLKDAQLKYLQSQINPHFLFNTLNAGMQLATIEDAEKTAVYIENMAEFFRYNLSKINEDTSLRDEVRLVDHYIYILNVRFTGDVHYSKKIDEKLLNVQVPSMILQPLIENAVQYGIRDIDWQGEITLTIEQKNQQVRLIVSDNGKGMTDELIQRVLSGENVKNENNRKSNGIGVYNVLERLQLYYGIEDVMDIVSDGENMGTKFILKIPYV